jgi:lysophospholipase L1-like esterase
MSPRPSAARRALRCAGLLVYAAALLLSVEAAAQVAYRVSYGFWLFRGPGFPGYYNHRLFRKHPWLVGVPAPSARGSHLGITVSHNSLGFRGPEIALAKAPGTVRVVTLGGSTTYGAEVSDDATWPYLLGVELGRPWQVVNLGVPGYTTVEHLIQTAFWLTDLRPDVAVYYEGWNDLRNTHVRGLRPDYSDFHGRSQFDNLALFTLKRWNKLASLHFARVLVAKTLLREPDGEVRVRGTPEALTAAVDARALDLYVRNLRGIAALNRALGIETVFVPQILNDAALTSDRPYDWVPFVRRRDLPAVLAAYNAALERVARETGAGFVAPARHAAFGADDFVDIGHFSPSGSRKFADVLARYLRADRRTRVSSAR